MRLLNASVLICCCLVLGCGSPAQQANKPDRNQIAVTDSSATVPTTPSDEESNPNAIKFDFERILLYQPSFNWNNGEESFQGTGFLVKAPNQQTVAITSYHFLDGNEAKLLKACWFNYVQDSAELVCERSWLGQGYSKLSATGIDRSRDFVIFELTKQPTDLPILELDERTKIPIGEEIWFPDKQTDEKHGHKLYTGKVLLSSAKLVFVEVNGLAKLQSQSGSPIISQKTGKVIGILAGGSLNNGDAELTLTPARAILDALQQPSQSKPLSEVIGSTATK